MYNRAYFYKCTPTSAIQIESSDNKGTPIPTTKTKEEATPTPTKSPSSSSAFLTDIKEKETITDGLCEELEKVDASF